MITPVVSLALFGASAAALSVGSAIVQNSCSYNVFLADVPAADGGYKQSTQWLQPGETWNQTWTELTNGNGWSIKLAKDDALINIMQYEYTFHNDGIIWYDLSDVNGNPWDGDWEITADAGDDQTCAPRQAAYQYSTDDAYGMQSCPQNAVIKVNLCSGEAAASSSASVTPTPSPTSSASSTSAATWSVPSISWQILNEASTSSTPSPTPTPTPTTLATAFKGANVLQAATEENGAFDVVVTDVEIAYVTEWVTARSEPTPEVARRHVHHPHQRVAV